ncbi:MAG: hypothetical protein KDC53_16180 [Saprospiraceae bacterium]|nr:hypothetical protein [Saprospiraceae bacterium]
MDVDSIQFVTGLETGNLDQLKTVPKGDRHCHMDLGGNFNYFQNVVQRSITKPPPRFCEFEDFQRYILDHLDPIFATTIGTKLAKECTIRQCKTDTVVLLEASIDDGFSYHFPDTPHELIDFITNTIKQVFPALNFQPELGLGRSLKTNDLEEIAYFNIDTGYFSSIDLYGDELNDDPRRYIPIFRYAREKGMKLKVHIGEFCSPDLISKTIDLLEVDEIQHGNNAVGSVMLMHFLAENEISVNMCPTSNLKLGVIDHYQNHPSRVLFDHGVKVTLNTDDYLIFGSSLSEEYLRLFECGLFSAQELNQIRLNGLS